MVELRMTAENHIVDGHHRRDAAAADANGQLVAQAVIEVDAFATQLPGQPARPPQRAESASGDGVGGAQPELRPCRQHGIQPVVAPGRRGVEQQLIVRGDVQDALQRQTRIVADAGIVCHGPFAVETDFQSFHSGKINKKAGIRPNRSAGKEPVSLQKFFIKLIVLFHKNIRKFAVPNSSKSNQLQINN